MIYDKAFILILFVLWCYNKIIIHNKETSFCLPFPSFPWNTHHIYSIVPATKKGEHQAPYKKTMTKMCFFFSYFFQIKCEIEVIYFYVQKQNWVFPLLSLSINEVLLMAVAMCLSFSNGLFTAPANNNNFPFCIFHLSTN